MFSNRHSRRRFRLGNLARLVQLRQSVSHQPPSPPKTLHENLSQSPPLQSQSQHLLHPKTNQETLSQSPPPFQPQLPPHSPPQFPPSTLNTTKESQSQSSPPLPRSKSVDETRFLSSPQPQALSPSILQSGEFQPPLPPEAKILPSTLNASEESHPKTPPSPLPPSKSINETRFQSPPLSDSSGSQAIDETQSESHPPSPAPPSKSNEELNSTLSLPESGQQSRYQTHSSPPPLSSLLPEASENLQTHPVKPLPPSSPTALAPPSKSLNIEPQLTPRPSLPLTKPNPLESHPLKPINSESHTKQEGQIHNPERAETSLTKKIPKDKKDLITEKVNKNRGNAIWSGKQNSMPTTMMLFVNSNVQGINTSLSLDSSSIDHEPGVHFIIH